MRRALLAIVLSAWAVAALADYDAVSAHGIDLSGRWQLNAELSDDAAQALAERQERERKQNERWRRQEEMMTPPGMPPMPDADDDTNAPARVDRPRRQRPWQKQREEDLRKMLGISETLTIRQSGSTVEIISAVDSRRYVAGSHTQVSMPQGQLADCDAGWSRDWFVVERDARRGPRVIEKFRLLSKTGQLEYTMAWSGDSELSGIKVRRVFDRMSGEVAPADPAGGPVP